MHTFDYINGSASDQVTREVKSNGNIVWIRSGPWGSERREIIVQDGKQVAYFSTAGPRPSA